MRSIFFSLLIIFSSYCSGQDSFLPANLGSEINSEYDELYPVLTPDGNTLYFIRNNHPENTFGSTKSQEIWLSKKNEDGSWSEAEHANAPFNNIRFNTIYSIPGDGSNIYISGLFDKNGKWKNRGISVIPVLGFNDFGHIKSLKIKGYSKKNKGKFTQVTLNKEENLLILSFSPKWDSEKNSLYISIKKDNGKWTKPEKIKKGPGVFKQIYCPQIAPDSVNTLYFSARNDKSYSYSIYKIQTNEDFTIWGKPVKLGADINSKSFDGFISFNKTGSWAYFTSNREGSLGKSDIYKVKLFEDNPFVEVHATILNQYTRKPFKNADSLKLQINGNYIDTVLIEKDGTFKVSLPLGKKFIFEPELPNYKGIKDTIDNTNQKEFKMVEEVFYLAPFPYALLKGQIKVRNSKETVNTYSNPEILVNGKKPDSIQIDDAGNYSIRLDHGRTYILTVRADNFVSGEEKIDLRDVHEYRELEKDLFLNIKPEPKKKEALVTGKIINSKTLKAIDTTVNAEIFINDFPSLDVTVEDSIYTLKLPLGQSYELSASADFFYPSVESIDLSNEKEKVKIFKDLYLAPLDVGASVKLENIFFETGKAALKSESFAELDRVVQLLNDYPTIKIEISGHTDNVGGEEVNKKLSQARADAVAQYIASKGIPDERIVAMGYGMEKPVAENTTQEGRQKNRRVEFTILDR